MLEVFIIVFFRALVAASVIFICFAILTRFFNKNSNFGNLSLSVSTLSFFSGVLVLLLPFQRIPSIEVAGGTLRLSQILALILVLLFLSLILFKDTQLLKKQLPSSNWLFFLFFVVQLPNLYLIENTSRFIISYTATIIAFLMLFFISNFTTNFKQIFNYIGISSLIVLVFTYYQIIADTAGLSPTLTLINPLHGANVFGFTRAHGFFNEPAYLANALFLYCGFWFLIMVKKINIFESWIILPSKLKQILNSNFNLLNVSIFLLLLLLQVLTIAKSSWILMPFAYALLIILCRKTVLKTIAPISALLLKLAPFVVLTFIILTSLYLNTESFKRVLNNIDGTLSGNSATFVERNGLYNAALDYVPQYYFFGTGSGQFGTVAKEIINVNLEEFKPIDGETSGFIVFNTYVEILLENGFFGLIVYLILFFYAAGKGLLLLKSEKFETENDKTILQSCLFFLTCCFFNFFYISPIYIYPFFIILGVVYSFIFKFQKNKYER